MGKGERFSPTDLVGTALAGCVLTTMGIVAQRKGIELAGAVATVRKIMTSEPPRRIARLEVEVVLPLDPDHPERALLEAASWRNRTAGRAPAEVPHRIHGLPLGREFCERRVVAFRGSPPGGVRSVRKRVAGLAGLV
jgi:putative redox protein